MVFFVIIGTIAAVASSMSSSTQNVRNEHMKQMNSIEKQEQALLNPYVMQKSSQKQYGESVYQEVKREIPVISDINYCRYCGEKIDRDAKFCHQCGIRL
jgi:hypothetical protein